MDEKVFKRLRQLNSLTQTSAAERLGVSRALLAMVETSQRPISDKLEHKIKTEFGQEQIDQVKRISETIDKGAF